MKIRLLSAAAVVAIVLSFMPQPASAQLTQLYYAQQCRNALDYNAFYNVDGTGQTTVGIPSSCLAVFSRPNTAPAGTPLTGPPCAGYYAPPSVVITPQNPTPGSTYSALGTSWSPNSWIFGASIGYGGPWSGIVRGYYKIYTNSAGTFQFTSSIDSRQVTYYDQLYISTLCPRKRLLLRQYMAPSNFAPQTLYAIAADKGAVSTDDGFGSTTTAAALMAAGVAAIGGVALVSGRRRRGVEA